MSWDVGRQSRPQNRPQSARRYIPLQSPPVVVSRHSTISPHRPLVTAFTSQRSLPSDRAYSQGATSRSYVVSHRSASQGAPKTRFPERQSIPRDARPAQRASTSLGDPSGRILLDPPGKVVQTTGSSGPNRRVKSHSPMLIRRNSVHSPFPPSSQFYERELAGRPYHSVASPHPEFSVSNLDRPPIQYAVRPMQPPLVDQAPSRTPVPLPVHETSWGPLYSHEEVRYESLMEATEPSPGRFTSPYGLTQAQQVPMPQGTSRIPAPMPVPVLSQTPAKVTSANGPTGSSSAPQTPARLVVSPFHKLRANSPSSRILLDSAQPIRPSSVQGSPWASQPGGQSEAKPDTPQSRVQWTPIPPPVSSTGSDPHTPTPTGRPQSRQSSRPVVSVADQQAASTAASPPPFADIAIWALDESQCVTPTQTDLRFSMSPDMELHDVAPSPGFPTPVASVAPASSATTSKMVQRPVDRQRLMGGRHSIDGNASRYSTRYPSQAPGADAANKRTSLPLNSGTINRPFLRGEGSSSARLSSRAATKAASIPPSKVRYRTRSMSPGTTATDAEPTSSPSPLHRISGVNRVPVRSLAATDLRLATEEDVVWEVVEDSNAVHPPPRRKIYPSEGAPHAEPSRAQRFVPTPTSQAPVTVVPVRTPDRSHSQGATSTAQLQRPVVTTRVVPVRGASAASPTGPSRGPQPATGGVRPDSFGQLQKAASSTLTAPPDPRTARASPPAPSPAPPGKALPPQSPPTRTASGSQPPEQLTPEASVLVGVRPGRTPSRSLMLAEEESVLDRPEAVDAPTDPEAIRTIQPQRLEGEFAMQQSEASLFRSAGERRSIREPQPRPAGLSDHGVPLLHLLPEASAASEAPVFPSLPLITQTPNNRSSLAFISATCCVLPALVTLGFAMCYVLPCHVPDACHLPTCCLLPASTGGPSIFRCYKSQTTAAPCPTPAKGIEGSSHICKMHMCILGVAILGCANSTGPRTQSNPPLGRRLC